MKQFLTLALFLCLSSIISAQDVDIVDPGFLQHLIDAGYDTNSDGIIQLTEAEAITELIIPDAYIMDYHGIAEFANLERLELLNNVGAAMLNISGLEKLSYVDLSSGSFNFIEANELASLDTLRCLDCFGVASLDLINATSLSSLELDNSFISAVNIAGASSLESFDCPTCTGLMDLFLDGAIALKSIRLRDSEIFYLNLDGLVELEYVECTSCFMLSDVTLTGANKIKELILTDSGLLTELEISALTELEVLRLNFNMIQSLDVAMLTNLRELECSYNDLQELDISALTNLEVLDCSFNPLLTELDISNLDALRVLRCTDNTEIEELDVADKVNLEVLECGNNALTELPVTDLVNLTTLVCFGNEISELDVAMLTQLEVLSCSGNAISNLDLTNLNKLETLFIGSNNISSVDLSNIDALRRFACINLGIGTLDLSEQDSLEFLNCSGNMLSSLDISNLKILEDVFIGDNNLTSFELVDFPKLRWFDCGQTSLIDLTIRSCPVLDNLDASHFLEGSLETIEITDCPLLSFINLENLKLRTFTLSQNSSDPVINLRNNRLETVFIRNGANDFLELEGNTDLQYICADDFELLNVQLELDALGLGDVSVNSYCPYIDGGQAYRISGRSIFDADNNGCNEQDAFLPNFKFEIDNGTDNGIVLSGTSGNYNIYLAEGTYTVVPVLEDPTAFSVSPSSLNVEFPGSTDLLLQDFCIEPIGTKDDVEVYMVPLEEARPGFETDYKLVYSNKGNTIQSGTVRLFYSAMTMELISANPEEDNATGNLLFWSFEDLKPFEKREIRFTMELNSPMDDPPLNGGDKLSFIASIAIDDVDDINPGDNQDVFRQLVVNSFDPNDKTCLNGQNIEPELVGEFIRYMIRFENTGTAEAVNIVVRDSIDPVAFDINTLVPLDASHPMRTQIEGDIVEFIFQDINLPFDDDTNDGYIVFKIKTRDNLVLGDVIENTAEIYFDFNFPIITNTTSTTVAIPNNIDDLASNMEANVYPNPVSETLYVYAEEQISAATIYDLNGKVMYIVDGADKQELMLPVKQLTDGFYLLRLSTSKGMLSRSFIKN